MKKILILFLTIYSISGFGQILIDPTTSISTARYNSAVQGKVNATGTDTYIVDYLNTGNANTGITTYTGLALTVQFANANTGVSTFNINGLGAKTIKKQSGGALVDLSANDIGPNERKDIYYDGTYIVLKGGTGSGGISGLTVGTTTIASGTDTKVLYNNAGTLGEYIVTGTGNAVLSTDPTFTTRINVPEIKATSSAGVDIHNNSGTQVAIFGAGGGTGGSLIGTTNIGSGSADYFQMAGGSGTITNTATGSSTNIDINLIPKGTGKLKSGGSNVILASGAGTDYAPATTSNQFLKGNGSGGFTNQNSIGLGGSDVSGTLPIANGGTGQTTANAGLNALLPSQSSASGKILQSDGTNTSWVPNSGNITPQTLTDGTTITWNVANGINADVTLGATGRTLSITNSVAGQVYLLKIIQDGTGSRTITTWPTGTKWVGNTAPTLTTTASAIDIVMLYYDGTNYFGTYSYNYN